MTDDISSRRRSLRQDPVSIFLLLSAALLTLMFTTETCQQSKRDLQAERARAIAAQASLQEHGCRVGSAGQRGEVLMVYCGPSADLQIVEEILATEPGMRDFEDAVVRRAALR